MTITAPETAADLPVRLDQFLVMFGDSMTAEHVGERLVCSEAEVLAELFEGLGAHQSADFWRAGHLSACIEAQEHVPAEAVEDETDADEVDALTFCHGYVRGRFGVVMGDTPDDGKAWPADLAAVYERGRKAGLEFASQRDGSDR